MILSIRIECPICGWGYKYHNKDINQGYRKALCHHCNNTFTFKITINNICVSVIDPKDNKRINK